MDDEGVERRSARRDVPGRWRFTSDIERVILWITSRWIAITYFVTVEVNSIYLDVA
jgi:hypothetical protein